MSAFKGYYMKINDCEFRDPQLTSFKYSPALVQVTDAGVVASGRLTLKVLPHTRRKISCSFPFMKPIQFNRYWKALRGDEPAQGMYLSVEVYDAVKDAYVTDTYYHNDLSYEIVIVNGERWVKIDDFDLIGH